MNQSYIHGLQTYYWREGNHEVDFVIVKGDRVVAIEVKAGGRPAGLSGLSVFTRRYKPCRSVTVGKMGMELKEFLETPILEWFSV